MTKVIISGTCIIQSMKYKRCFDEVVEIASIYVNPSIFCENRDGGDFIQIKEYSNHPKNMPMTTIPNT